MRYIKTIFNKWLIALFVVGLAMAGNTLYAQIKVLNIPDGSDVRGLSPDGRAQPNYASYNGVYWRTTFGYHLDGQRTLMHTHYDATNGYTYYYSIADMTRAKAKLTNTANFGPSGTVPYSLSITSNYGVKGSITDIDLIDDYDIIFIGLYDRSYATNKAAFTPEEIAILQEWSAKPGKVLLVMEQALNPTVSAATGYTIVDGSNTNPTTALPYDAQLDINIFSGVFGNSTGISQNGSSQGYFNSNCGGLPLGNNVNGKSTIIFNRKYRDLYFADTGFFTRLNNSNATGQLSAGGAITNATDIAWANIWAWAVSEVVNNVDPGYTSSGGTAYTNQALPLLTGTDAVISLKDNTEQIIRWETSTDGGATWTTINSTSLTITYANPQDGQQFRAVTGNLPECEETISEPVTITTADCSPSGITSVNLNSLFTGTLPDPAVVLEWWTHPNRDLDPLNPGTKVDDPTNVTESGTYYAFFYDPINDCYNTDNSTASVVVNILPPCDDCGDQIFFDDFGTSDKDVNKGRTTSPYMPASNSFTFATPYPDSNNSNETAIDNNHYAVVAPGYIKSGWKPGDLGWYFWTPAYDEPNTVTDMSETEEGAVMVVNAGNTLAPFYRREVTLEYDTYYHAAFSIFVKNETSRVGIKVGNSSSNQVYGMMFSQEFTSADAGKWIDVELTFKVPADADADCDMENVYLEFFNAKAATIGNDYYIDNIFLEKLDVAGACPTPEDFITLVCPADGGSDCTKEPATGTPDGFTKVGISTMEKQTQGWPENIANGFIALDSKEKGFVITRVESESSITDPKEGMLIYDIEDQCVKLHNGEEWSCLNQECSAGFTLLCNSFSVISGELHAGQWQGLSGILPFANGDGSAFTPLYNIPSEGITGLTANITLPGEANGKITEGSGGFFNVSISGSASAAGIATFPIEINGAVCSIQVEILP